MNSDWFYIWECCYLDDYYGADFNYTDDKWIRNLFANEYIRAIDE
jgi:hypothetical protein